MRPSPLRLAAALAVVLLVAAAVHAEPDVHDTRLLTQPTVSAKHVAFIYADDLWVADVDGANVRRLTSDIGVESHPVFSPDGKTIAFSAQYDGNTDVYTIPVEGGSPTRLTWHPGVDLVRGWTPDGKSIVFSSPRSVFTGRYTQLFTVPTTGGMPTQLSMPNGVQASFAPDGERIAYTPLSDRSTQWKHYRGGTHSRIWVFSKSDNRVEQVPQPDTRCNDLDPNWVGDLIYFRSDRGGEYNLFSYDTKAKKVNQLTHYKDFPVEDVGSGGGKVAFEQAGYVHLYNPDKEEDKRLKIGVATDLVEARPRFVKGAKYIRSAALSPSGARAVFEFRGEIVTVPAEKGDARNLTNSPGANDRSPAWSPDGKSIAYFSDAGGEYQLHVRAADGKGDAKTYKLGGAGFYEAPAWSPDSKKIAFIDNSNALYWIDLEGGKVKKIATEPLYGPTNLRTLRAAWSPDSKWIAYTLGNKAAYHTVYTYDLAADKSRAITDGLSDAIDPVFDAGGKYLFFLASTDAGPVNQWFAQSNADMRVQRSIYLVVLKKGVPSPLVRESDEEKADADKPKDKDTKDKKAEPVAIDFDGIDQRILALPLVQGVYRNLQAGAAGQLFFLESPAAPPRDGTPRGSALKRFDLAKRKAETVLDGVADYDVSADGKKALVFSPPETWSIVDATGPPPNPPPPAGGGQTGNPPPAGGGGQGGGKGKLHIDAIEVRVEPRAEWVQIFDEAWRINRDYFYDPHMHGTDWKAVKQKYATFLPHLATRGDLDRVIRMMLSELAVGHSNTGPGERPFERKTVPGGLLGADYEIANDRYRFKKVYGGLNWTPELRAPLTVPGVDVKAGEYLLAVRGIDLKPPTELYSLFENTANKSIEITVGPNADGTGSRTVVVEPLAGEEALRNMDWVEGNLKKVKEATGGRVAYVYVPNTAALGHDYFKRYFFPQADKQAIIVDERFNGGGQVADYYIDHLRRPFTAMWATRYGEDLKTPGAAIVGPKVMIIDETAGSGGDLLPWMFRKYKLGTLVGKRTWGGLVGILGFPVLMDGGRVTAPNLAIWTEDGWVVENEGVPPDIEVEQWPADVIAGKDPQLEKAIEVVLKELEKNPPKELKRPPFPQRISQEKINSWPGDVEKALGKADKNRDELEKALNQAPEDQRKGMAFLVANMPDGDLKALHADFLLENVELAYKARKEVAWGKQIPEDIFLNDILAYANVDESRDPWRKEMYDLCMPLVKDCKTPGEAAQKLNETVFTKLKVKYSTQRRRANQSPKESIEQGLASCTGLSIVLSDACRSVCIPARLAGTPLWANKSGNHTWVEIWDNGWHFTGACEADPKGLDRGWFVDNASQAKKDVPEHAIYAASFRKTDTSFPLVWARNRKDVFAENVTERYAKKDKPADNQVRVLIRVWQPGKSKRLAVPVTVADPDDAKKVFEGESRGETADTNDLLAFSLLPDHEYVLRAGKPVRVEKKFKTAAGKEQTLEIELPADDKKEPALSKEQAAQVEKEAAAFFAATEEERAKLKFDDKVDRLLAGNDPAVRAIVWKAYQASAIHDKVKKDFEDKKVRYTEYVSPYVVREVGKKPEKGWPLVIAMHGGGGAPKTVNDSQWEVMQRYYKDHAEVSGYKYLALRAPNDTWNGFYDDYVPPLIVNLIRQFTLLGEIDPDKVFLMGYSHGGYGAFFIGPKIPDRFAAVHCSASAPTDGTISPLTLRNTRFTFMVGEQDNAYGRRERCEKFDKEVQKLKDANKDEFPVEFELKKGFGHGGLPDRDKLKEMLPYTRNPVPRHLSWEVTDAVITDFFWLTVAKPEKGQSIDVTLRDNTAQIKTSMVKEFDLDLDARLVAPDKPLKVVLDGKAQEVTLRPQLRTLCESLLQRGDPELAFTCEVHLVVEKKPD